MKILLRIFSLTMLLANAHAEPITMSVFSHAKALTISLPANPTTGYRWFLRSWNTQILTLADHHFEAQNNGLMGAPGAMHYRFALQPGKSWPAQLHFMFEYNRPFEKGSGMMQEVVVNRVEAAAVQ
ncbi:secreted protein [Legionella geestiana]|uniref:Secreted protein n=1 Tax=Legionella geestiana TaxID=45065 RepID=A0A0W0TSK3_9GAMM|nr:protease inhibitor I42 family protein [Legionella geestiana]KTC98496.1 secreted protein [Legionella geestiana]QBS13100.1 hypothetical protein E4T54_10320 [Legionella geestiana]STX54385.1 secreted protein [Legionella geestiana]